MKPRKTMRPLDWILVVMLIPLNVAFATAMVMFVTNWITVVSSVFVVVIYNAIILTKYKDF